MVDPMPGQWLSLPIWATRLSASTSTTSDVVFLL